MAFMIRCLSLFDSGVAATSPCIGRLGPGIRIVGLNLSMRQRTTTLLAWCGDNGILIDPRLQILDDIEYAGIGVCSRDLYIPPFTTCEIPPLGLDQGD